MRSAYWRIATINIRLRQQGRSIRLAFAAQRQDDSHDLWLRVSLISCTGLSHHPQGQSHTDLLSDKCRFHCRHHQSFDVSSPRSFPYIVFNSYLRLYFPSRLYIGSKLKIPCKHKRTPNLPMVPDSSATTATPSRRIHIDCRHPIKF
jgi:hypothetical protein